MKRLSQECKITNHLPYTSLNFYQSVYTYTHTHTTLQTAGQGRRRRKAVFLNCQEANVSLDEESFSVLLEVGGAVVERGKGRRWRQIEISASLVILSKGS